MSKIIPRYEFRTFAQSFGIVETKMRNLSKCERLRESSDIYILSELSMENTKVRNNVMDIKSLQRVTEDGLEQWKPIKKAEFPLLVREIKEVFQVFNVPVPPLSQEEYALDEFLRLIKEDDNFISLTVDKSRSIYTISECIVELSDLVVEGRPIKTIAVELEDPEKVRDTVKVLGLSGLENINYVVALKRMHRNEL